MTWFSRLFRRPDLDNHALVQWPTREQRPLLHFPKRSLMADWKRLESATEKRHAAEVWVKPQIVRRKGG